MSRVLNFVLTSQEDPTEELFELVRRNSVPGPNGTMDLQQAQLNIEIGKLHGQALKDIMRACWNGVQWNWNVKSAYFTLRSQQFVELRVKKPEGL